MEKISFSGEAKGKLFKNPYNIYIEITRRSMIVQIWGEKDQKDPIFTRTFVDEVSSRKEPIDILEEAFNDVVESMQRIIVGTDEKTLTAGLVEKNFARLYYKDNIYTGQFAV